MKKKILPLMLFMICSIFLTGCIKVDTEVTLDKRGNAQIEGKFLVNEVLSNRVDEEYSEFKENSKENHLEVAKVSENGYVGVKQIYKTEDFNKNDIRLPEIFEPTNVNKRFLTVKHNLFFVKTNIDWTAHFTEINNRVLTKEDQSLFESTLKINIPVKATFSNADSRNDMTNSYEWKLEPTKDNKIQLEYKIINWLNVILFTLFTVSIISLIVLLVLKQNKKIILTTSTLPTVLLIYFLIVSCFCFVENKINEKSLPTNYYNLAKKDYSLVVDDFAIAKVDDKYGLVDKENNFIVEPENKFIENLNGDYCLICKEDKNACAYFNKKTKKYLTKFKYMCSNDTGSEYYDVMTSSTFVEGLARIVVNNHNDIKVGFIDGKGIEVIPPKYVYATNFIDGQAVVKTSFNSPEIYIDKTGKEIKKSKDEKVNDTKDENKPAIKQENVVKKIETKNLNKQTTLKQTPKVTKQQTQEQENSEIDDFIN